MNAMEPSRKRHRFQKLDERLANLQNELQLHGKSNATDLALTFFEELQLQAELTTLDTFHQLYRQIYPLVITTPQLLHHLPKIVALLQKELQCEDSEVKSERLTSVLKLIAALARELRKEFYPYFASILEHAVTVVDPANPELSTQVFKALTLLFNYLRSHLLEDMNAIQKFFLPLLGNAKPFIRDFASQTLAGLLRRMDTTKELKSYVKAYLVALCRGSARDNENLLDGSSKLLFALMKNVNHSFHSRMPALYTYLLGSFRTKNDLSDDRMEQLEALYSIVFRTSELMKRHTDEAHCGKILICFESVAKKHAAASESDGFFFGRLVSILNLFVGFRRAKLLAEVERNRALEVVKLVLEQSKVMNSSEQSNTCRKQMFRLLKACCVGFPEHSSLHGLLKSAFATYKESNDELVRTFWNQQLFTLTIDCLEECEVEFVKTQLFPLMLDFAFEELLDDDVMAFGAVVCKFYDYAKRERGFAVANERLTLLRGRELICVGNTQADVKKTTQRVVKTVVGLFRELLQEKSAGRIDSVVGLWKLLEAVNTLSLDQSQCKESFLSLLEQIKCQANGGNPTFAVFRSKIWSAVNLHGGIAQRRPFSALAEALEGNENSFSMLTSVLALQEQCAPLGAESTKPLYHLLESNLRSPCHALREVSLKLLSQCGQLRFAEVEDATLQGDCNLVELCLELETLCDRVCVQLEREIVRLLTRVKILCGSSQTPLVAKQIAFSHCFGLYHVKFATIWPHVADIISTTLQLHFQDLWPTVETELRRATLQRLPTETDNGRHPRTEGGLERNDSVFVRHVIQEYDELLAIESGRIDASDVTDDVTHHTMLLKGLLKCVGKIETKTRVVVPIFLTFLRDQYARIYVDELSSEFLNGVQDSLDRVLTEGVITNEPSQPLQQLTTKAVRSKLVDFLKLFAAFRNMKGAYAHSVLNDFFIQLLTKTDEIISKLALQCIFGYGFKYLNAYKEQLSNLQDSATFREEIAKFSLGDESGVILKEHREGLLPILMRILFAKCITRRSRNGGDTLANRRAVVFAYLAALNANELVHFVRLLTSPFDVSLPIPGDRHYSAGVFCNVSNVPVAKKLGFLNMLEEVIAQLGKKVSCFVPAFMEILVSILKHAVLKSVECGMSASICEDDEGHQDGAEELVGNWKQIRVLSYRRAGEIIETFDNSVDLGNWIEVIISESKASILQLPSAVIGADKPPALLEFLVVLVGASRASQVLRKENWVIETVLSCLSSGLDTQGHGGIHHQLLDCILLFTDYLIDQVEEAGQTQASSLLVPNIPFILDQFVRRFQHKTSRFQSDKYAGSSKKELMLLCRLSQFVAAGDSEDSACLANTLFQLLVPFTMGNHRLSLIELEKTLEVLSNLVPLVLEPKKYVSSLSRLLAPGNNCVSDRNARTKLADLFVALGKASKDEHLKRVSDVVADLNAFDPSKIEEIDFDRRMSALNDANHTKFEAFRRDAVLLVPVVSQYLHSMHETEFSIRSAAFAGIKSLVEWAGQSVANDNDEAHCTVLNVLESVIMPCTRSSLKSPLEDIRKGFVSLLGTVADQENLHENKSFHGDLRLLRDHNDPEADFFYNICHIQAHRKRRALQRLGSLMGQMSSSTNATGVFSNSTVNNILVPLILHFIFEKHAKAQISLNEEAAACLGKASALLGWSNYQALLRQLLKSIEGHQEAESAIITAICHVVDNFHFECPNTADEWIQEAEASHIEQVEPNRLQQVLTAQILPLMKKFLLKRTTIKKTANARANAADFGALDQKANADVMVRVPLALAIVKVLRRLPAREFFLEFPKLLLNIVKLLKSRDESVRASARTTLVRVSVELGPGYLLPIVNEMEHTLRDGYMVHVLSYSLYAVLEKLSGAIVPMPPTSLLLGVDCSSTIGNKEDGTSASSLDACIPNIMRILVASLFANVVENQDGSEFKSKMKEAKSCRSFDSLELLASCVPFLPSKSIHVMVSAVVIKFQEVGNPKSRDVLHESLKRIALGLAKNRSVEISYGFLYVYNLLSSSLEQIRPLSNEEKEKYAPSASLLRTWLVSDTSNDLVQKRQKAYDTFHIRMQQRMTGFDLQCSASQSTNSVAHVEEVLYFSVRLLYAFLRKSEIVATLVDPLVPHLLRCVAEIKHNQVVIDALKCLSTLLNYPDIPSVGVILPALTDRLFKTLQKAGAATRNEMVQTCYRALTVVLRHRSDFRLTEAQLRVLLSYLRADLDEKDHQNATFATLRAVVASKLVIAEVYDVMVRVGEMMVQSDTQTARSSCSSIYINFLLEYPMGQKRLSHHLRFLVNNLGYVHESGRKSVLECLSALMKKLPIDMLNERSQFFMLPLVLRLVNDESAECRQLVSEVITVILRRVGNNQLTVLMELIRKWWNPHGSDKKLWCLAAQVSGLVFETRGTLADNVVVEILNNAQKILQHQLHLVSSVEESAQLPWQVSFHVMTLVAKMISICSSQVEQWLCADNGSCFWDETVLPLMEFPHIWVRVAALRFLNSYVERRDPKTLTFVKPLRRSVTIEADFYLKQPNRLFRVTRAVSKQFEKAPFNADMAEQVLMALPFLLSALDLLQTHGVQVKDDETTALCDDEDEEQEANELYTSEKSQLGWILTRLSFICRRGRTESQQLAQSTIYKLFAALVSENDPKWLETYLVHMINPLYLSSTNDHRVGPTTEEKSEVSLLAQEVLEMLERKVDSETFVSVFTSVQKKIAAARAMRKEKRKREAVVDPEAAARRKMRKNEMKRTAKQLKKRKFSVLKGSGVANKRQKAAARAQRPGAS